MKFAVTSQGPDRESLVDPRFGRARYFRVTDTETGQQTVVDNASRVDAVQGAGIQAAQALASLGVQALVTGHVGPKAWATLQAARIEVYGVDGGTVAQAMEAFMARKLAPLSGANVEGHW